MSPIELLSVLLLVLAGILAVDRFYRRRRARTIAAVGAEFRMNYSPLDRFALTERLMTLRAWTMRASDLMVKDVLYTTHAGVRCFVATVKCRWSLDEAPSRFIVRVFERADHQNHFEIVSEPSRGTKDDVELYRKLIKDWSGADSQTVTAAGT